MPLDSVHHAVPLIQAEHAVISRRRTSKRPPPPQARFDQFPAIIDNGFWAHVAMDARIPNNVVKSGIMSKHFLSGGGGGGGWGGGGGGGGETTDGTFPTYAIIAPGSCATWRLIELEHLYRKNTLSKRRPQVPLEIHSSSDFIR